MYKHQSGFIQGTILFALAILVVVISAFALSNRGSVSTSDRERDRVNAGLIMKEAADFRDSYARYLADGNRISNLATNWATGGLFFRANVGYSSVQSLPPADIFADDATVRDWTLHTDFNVDGIGSATTDYVVILPDITKGICLRVNNMLYASAMDAEDPTVAAQDGVVAGTPQNGAAGSMKPVTLASPVKLADSTDNTRDIAVTAKPEGCIQYDTGKFAYYKVLVER